MVSIWNEYRKDKPKESNDYLCVILLTEFKGGDYSIEQVVLKYDVTFGGFNCGSGKAVLFWTECPKLPNYLSISEVLWN